MVHAWLALSLQLDSSLSQKTTEAGSIEELKSEAAIATTSSKQ
jgi:hypothetical protein